MTLRAGFAFFVLLFIAGAFIWAPLGCGDDDDDDSGDGSDDDDLGNDDDAADDDMVDDDDSGDDDVGDDDDTVDDDDDASANYALNFDGANDYVSIADSFSLDATGSVLTVEAWVKVNELERGNQTIVSKGFRGSSLGYMIRINHLDSLTFDIGDGSGCSASDAFPISKLNEWVHVAGVYSSPNSVLYLNGSAFASNNSTCSLGSTDDDLHIGSMTTAFFFGHIDEVRVSSVARYSTNFIPEDEFSSDQDTLGLWHFDEGTGNTTTDSSPNGNDGTLEGPTWVEHN